MISTVCMHTGIRYPNNIFSKFCFKRMVASLCQIFNASTHSHKWGPKERPTLDNIGPHDIIIDHQFD